MNDIINDLDKYFSNGVVNGAIAIVITIIVAIAINELMNIHFDRKYPVYNASYKRIKKVVIVLMAAAFITSELTFLSSFATALLASGGILAVVIGLASQEAASNLINGLMIMTYKPYKVGDWVKIHEHNITGKVIDIALRHSVVETIERTQVIVPNTIMNKSVIENISNTDESKATHLFVDVSYETDLDKAINIVQEIASNNPLTMDVRKKKDIKKGVVKVPVHVTEFKDSGIELRATIYTKDNIEAFQALSDLRKEIKTEFDKEGISIPYPHREIIINNKGESK